MARAPARPLAALSSDRPIVERYVEHAMDTDATRIRTELDAACVDVDNANKVQAP